MASFIRRPSNNAAGNPKKNIVRFGSSEPPAQLPKPAKKGSFISLLTGSTNNNNYYFDNGVDPLGRLSIDSAPPPPPSPVAPKKPEPEAPRHWTEEVFPLTRLPGSAPSPSADLVARVRYFLQQKDPSSVDRSLHLAIYAQQEGEPALNAKLFHRFGDGLPLRVPGQKGRKDDGPVPKTLRELLRAFLLEHDPGFLTMEGEAGLDEKMAQAAEYGIDSLESELVRKYGVGLSGNSKHSGRVLINPDISSPQTSRTRETSSFDQMAKAAAPGESSSPSPLSPVISQPKPTFEQVTGPPPTNAKARLDKGRSEKPQTFIELGLDEDDETRASVVPVVSPMATGAPKSRRHDFFDDKSLRADLKAFYQKHDQRKLDPQKFEPIVQWAYKIGPSELNRRFEEKYGESLNTFIDNVQAGRPGVSPGPKNAPKSVAEESSVEVGAQPVTCKNYSEAKPGKGFGVCVCGFSRVDHKQVRSLLVPGSEEPHFNRAKPKTVMSKNKAPSPTTKPPAQQVSQPFKVSVAPVPKFEVKAEGRDGPCSEYRLDLEGRSFGVCKCGWSRPEHYKAKQQVAWATSD